MNPNQTPYGSQDGTKGYKQLRRSRTNRKISGVCGGIGEYLDVDPNLIRLLLVVGTIITGGGLALAYLVAIFVMPDQPAPSVWSQSPNYGGYGTTPPAPGATTPPTSQSSTPPTS
jgi:phage shock protein PspC (stress-responsive transcriptional regulator)